MKIIIVGNGKVGYAIASQLAGEHHDIVMVDDNAVALQRAENALDVMCIEGNGASIRVLKEAGAQSADLVIAVTNLDDTNLLCCFIAKKLGAGHTIARCAAGVPPGCGHAEKEIGLDMVINPDLAAAQGDRPDRLHALGLLRGALCGRPHRYDRLRCHRPDHRGKAAPSVSSAATPRPRCFSAWRCMTGKW